MTMRFQQGKHAGKSFEEILLKKPDFVHYYTNTVARPAHIAEFRRLQELFSAKPFGQPCAGCGGSATRASGYASSDVLMFWCDTCDMYSAGAAQGKLTTIRTIPDALAHGTDTASRRRIVRRLAEAKGLPKRVGEKDALDFFR